MSKRALQASLALWRRRHRWNEKRRAQARKRGNTKAAKKYGKRLAVCVSNINRRKRQLQLLEQRKSIRAKAMKNAAKYIGTTERPAGSNSHAGTIIDRCQTMFGFTPKYPWCGFWSGYVLTWAGVKGVTSRIASVGFIEDDARAKRGPFRGWSDDARSALPGDLAVIGKYGEHVEPLEKIHADGSATTIGGNTSSGPQGSQSNGGGIWRRHRTAAEIRGVAHVDYPG